MQQLLQRYAQLQSVDLDQVQSHVSSVLCPHVLHLNNHKKTLKTELFYRSSPRLGFGRLRYGAAVHIRPQPLQDFYLLQIPIDGYEQIQISGQRFNYDMETASMINPEQEFEMQHSDQANKLFVRINRLEIERFFQEQYQIPLQGNLEFASLQSLTRGAGSSLWRLLQWQFNEASDGTLFDSPLAIQQIEDTFFASLLDIWPHNQSTVAVISTPLTPHTVKKAKKFIHDHLSHPLTVDLIAQSVGISTRSLYIGFNRFVGSSPMQYVKQQRLNYAHQQLLQSDPQQRGVTEIAFLAGFTHLGQFAMDYKRLFGVSPSTTLRHNG